MSNRSNEGLKALFNRATESHKAGELDEAAGLYRKLLSSTGDQFHVLRLLGHLEIQRGRAEEACKIFGRALRLEPESVEVLINRGNGLMELGRPDKALEDYDRALALSSPNERLMTNRGAALAKLRRSDEALEALAHAIAISPGAVHPYFNRGNIFLDLWRYEEALKEFDRVVEGSPDHVDAHHNRGVVLRALNRMEEALGAFDAALALRPHHVEALNSRRLVLQELGRTDEAIPALMALLEQSPDFPFARGSLLEARLHCCDWHGFDEQVAHIERELDRGKAVIRPFNLIAISDDPARQLRSADIFVRNQLERGSPQGWKAPLNRGKVRIAYLSADFREHPVALLLADVLEAHDRTRFETIGVSLGPDDGSALRRRLTGAFDEFLDLNGASNQQAVSTLRDRRIDIAIDLMGFTAGHRFDIFETRVAPIQVNYLGFAATIGSVSHDYVLADEYVVPEGAKSGFIEQVVYLPGSYLAMSRRPIALGVPTREQAGLPAEGRVFCAFNNQNKISPSLFDTWMRILTRVPGSVLWLRLDSAIARANLLKEAALRGVEADRLVFAPRVADHADHMARLSLADVFLDTFPYNAHATATDALLAGVPVITRSGRAFASRVAGSLLYTAGCPELVVNTLDDYERLAVELALDDSRLTALRNKVRANAASSEMFDPERYCRGLEAAYLEMCRRREPERAVS